MAPPAPPPAVQSPTSPVAVAQSPTTPRPQTPTAPRQVQSPTTPAPQPAPEPLRELDLATLRQVKEGMTLPDVMDLIGRPGFILSQKGEETIVYRWVEPGAGRLIARFENGTLTRKSVLPDEGAEDAAKVLDREAYEAIETGMGLDEVLTLLDVEPKSQSNAPEGVSIIRWEDAEGTSFTARFKDGKLVRKTGFHVTRKAEGATEAGDDDAKGPSAGAPAPPAPAETPVEAPEAPEENTAGPDETAQPLRDRKPRTKTTSTARRADDNERERSYNPKAKLPEFSHGLRSGAFEIRVTNPTEHRVKAGLRVGNKGVDVTVPPRSSRSVKVDRGQYQFYFVSDADPYTLSGGGGIDLTGMFATDLEISVIDEDYEVRMLDRAL